MTIKTVLEGTDLVFYDPDEQDKIELEYVYALTNSLGEGSDWEKHPERFWERFYLNEINEPFTKEQFLKERDIISTIKAFGLDVDKFWLLVLFIYDWSVMKFTKCHFLGDPIESLKTILDYLENADALEITFRVKGKKSRIADEYVTDVVLSYLKKKYDKIKDKKFGYILTYDDNHFSTTFNNLSYQMCYAADKFKRAFAAMKLPTKGKQQKDEQGCEISYNKMLLISRLIYFMRMTGNPNFKDSEDSLKGVLKAYANKLPSTESSVYFF